MRLPHAPAALAGLRSPTLDDPWRVLLSGCMRGLPVGVDGTDYGMPAHFPRWLEDPRVFVVPFCPEDAGIGTPRGMPDLHGGDGFDVLDGRARVLDERGQDLSLAMIAGAEAMWAAAQAHRVDFALLTDRSAACGSQVVSLGCRFEAPVRHRFGVGVAAALLLRHGVPVLSQRDHGTLERLHAILDPAHRPDPAARDHHLSPWVLANLGDPLARLEGLRYAGARRTLEALLDGVRRRLGVADEDVARRAAFWMVQIHLPQADRPDGAPYVAHTSEVAATVFEWCPRAPVEVLIAALLHDAVEDRAEALAGFGTATEGSARVRALAALEEGFGAAVRARVEMLSNVPGADYAAHVHEVIHADGWVAAIKLADFSTNAWRLDRVADPARRQRLVAKYRPVMADFRALLGALPEGHPLSEARGALREALEGVWARDYAG